MECRSAETRNGRSTRETHLFLGLTRLLQCRTGNTVLYLFTWHQHIRRTNSQQFCCFSALLGNSGHYMAQKFCPLRPSPPLTAHPENWWRDHLISLPILKFSQPDFSLGEARPIVELFSQSYYHLCF